MTRRALWVAAILSIAGGCGGDAAGPEKHTVSGRIVHGDEALGGVGLGFFATESEFIGGADAGEDGSYSVDLPAGRYNVTVALPTEEVQEVPGSPPMEVVVEDGRVSEKVQHRDTTPLQILVEDDMPDADFDLSLFP